MVPLPPRTLASPAMAEEVSAASRWWTDQMSNHMLSHNARLRRANRKITKKMDGGDQMQHSHISTSSTSSGATSGRSSQSSTAGEEEEAEAEVEAMMGDNGRGGGVGATVGFQNDMSMVVVVDGVEEEEFYGETVFFDNEETASAAGGMNVSNSVHQNPPRRLLSRHAVVPMQNRLDMDGVVGYANDSDSDHSDHGGGSSNISGDAVHIKRQQRSIISLPELPDLFVEGFKKLFEENLKKVLTERFTNHWYVEDPSRGSGYRALISDHIQYDTALLESLDMCRDWIQDPGNRVEGLDPERPSLLLQFLPNNVIMFCNPRRVCVRQLGGSNYHQVLNVYIKRLPSSTSSNSLSSIGSPPRTSTPVMIEADNHSRRGSIKT